MVFGVDMGREVRMNHDRVCCKGMLSVMSERAVER